MDSGGEDTVKEKSQIKDVFNDEEKDTESIEIEKQLKKEIRDVYVQVKRCCLLITRSAQAGLSIYHLRIGLYYHLFNPAAILNIAPEDLCITHVQS